MIGLAAFTVFALGLRHGADPDHLAAIDNLTRNAAARRPVLSRFVGTLFACGHSVMVLAIAGLVGYLGTRFTTHHELVETIGTWISIVVLVLIAVLNLRQLAAGSSTVTGLKTRLLPRAMRDATSPLVAIPIGLLFGFGFETSSQVAAYSVAFATYAGVAGALIVGGTFCLGMIVTDTLDSLLVHRLVSSRSAMLPQTMRVWIWSVTLLALGVAAYELAQVLGWQSPVPDIVVSGTLVASLLAVFAYVFASTRGRRETSDAAEPAAVLQSP
jgi:high-affinity nickel-transport protein